MHIGILTLYLQIPGCTSLKEKRSRLKPLLARLHREFNISVAEMGNNDAWQESTVVCTLASNDRGFTQRSLQSVSSWIETHWPDLVLMETQIELL